MKVAHMPKFGIVSLVICLSTSFVAEVSAKELICEVPLTEWQSRDEVKAFFNEKGMQISRIKIDDGCYELKAIDDRGREVEMKINPKTLEILEIEAD
uniref:PepSY domain-containing protein n=1 Tax=OCS116 cluster bacterium TaxID=2030921 RepID=A0A2A4YWC8_9PROT